jgi:hypothetical protein
MTTQAWSGSIRMDLKGFDITVTGHSPLSALRHAR